MVPRGSIISRWVIGLSLLVMILALGDCGGGGKDAAEQKDLRGFPIPGDHMVYVTSKTAEIPVAKVHTTGNPSGTGDQLAWALVIPGDPGDSISGITLPDSTCGPSTAAWTATWTPYPKPGLQGAAATSGPMTPPPPGTNDGSLDLWYRINLASGTIGNGPCGRMIIVKP